METKIWSKRKQNPVRRAWTEAKANRKWKEISQKNGLGIGIIYT